MGCSRKQPDPSNEGAIKLAPTTYRLFSLPPKLEPNIREPKAFVKQQGDLSRKLIRAMIS